MNVLKITIAVGFTLALAGCSGMKPTTFLHPEYNFGYVEKVAVIPFENLTQDQGAAARATRFCVSELLAAAAFDVVEPGEVARALETLGTLRTAELTKDQAVALGNELGCQGLILGSIGESATTRSGSSRGNVVTLAVRMIETDTGATVWSTTHTEGSRTFWSSFLGTGERSKSEVTRRCVEQSIGTLIN